MTNSSTSLGRKRPRFRWRWLAAGIAAWFLVGLLVSLHLQVNHFTVRLGLPEPVRVVVIADVHMSPWGPTHGFARRVVELANDQHPDLVLLLGDYVNSSASIPGVAEILRGLHAPSGVYAVLGNHDHWSGAAQVKAEFARQHIPLLVNRDVVVHKGRTHLCLAGMDDLTTGDPDLPKVIREAAPGMPLVLLSHNPDTILQPAAQHADLMISGHTHGGQIWLLGPYIAPVSPWGRRHLYGLYQKGHPWVFVTKGANLGRSPPRWYCPPEVAVLDLQ